jgi:hypothetical protein
MPSPGTRSRAALGFTVKSGWASAVLLAGSAELPRVVDSARVELSDPERPECRQPYHAGFGTARRRGPELSRLIGAVQQFGQQSVSRLIGGYEANGPRIRGIAIVVGSTIDPGRIANEHMRIHALEGQLFRSIVEEAAKGSGLTCSIWRDRDLCAFALGVLGHTEPDLRNTLHMLGRGIDGPWRAEQKAAALAAWLVLAGKSSRPALREDVLHQALQPKQAAPARRGSPRS